MLRFIKFLKLKVPNYFWITAGLHNYFRGGPNTSVQFWSTRTGGSKYFEVFGPGGTILGGPFIVTEHFPATWYLMLQVR